ncbi:restriction endonuclease [Granulicella sp. S156]|uniref:restriction endonuclease n=1 Tax=Granulicella sp. S156 TaxID=1747224 RepID=UPI00131B1A4F|nr:restriction endonuclease [Granulicella sp. S156]
MRHIAKTRELFERLLESEDAAGRGLAFERLLGARLTADGFTVHFNPKTARPRQTDLVAIRESQHFLIEAKWRKRNIDVGDVDNLRMRLNRIPSDIVGCIFNMSGYGSGAIKQVESDRTREILLFNAAEINSIFADRFDVHELIRRKREILRVEGRVWFDDPRPESSARRKNFPPTCREFRTKTGAAPLVAFPSDNDETTFFLDIPETGAIDTFVSMELRLALHDTAELADVLETIQETVGLSDQGTFSIQQLSHAWYGFGAQNFLDAIGNWERRYSDARLKSPHHSEALVFLDRSGGALIALTSRQRVGDSTFLHASELKIQLPGVPVDLSKIQELARKTGNPDALFQTSLGSGLHSAHFKTGQIKLVPHSKIVSADHGEEWVSGIVAKNPFTASRIKRLAGGLGEIFLRHLSEPKHLLCAVGDWYPLRDEVSNFSVRSVFGTSIGHVPVLNVRCTWEEHVLRSKDTSVNEALLAEIPDVIEPNDEPVDRLSHDAPKPPKKKRR